MAEVTYKGKSFEVDEDGFLLRFDDWCPEWLEYVKDSEGITELNEDHQKFLTSFKITTVKTVLHQWFVFFLRTLATN